MVFNLQVHIYHEQRETDDTITEAGIGTASVSVYDAGTGNLITSGETNADGIVYFSDLTTPQKGRIFVSVSKIGYASPNPRYFNVSDGSTAYVSIKMTASPLFNAVLIEGAVAYQDENGNIVGAENIPVYVKPIHYPQAIYDNEQTKRWLMSTRFIKLTDEKGEFSMPVPQNIGACIIEIPDAGITGDKAIVVCVADANINVGNLTIGVQK